jgi:hypothetical protein
MKIEQANLNEEHHKCLQLILFNNFVSVMQIARFKRQKAAESKLLEIKERKERRGRSTRASALSTPVEAGEEELLDDDGEEEREVCILIRYLFQLSAVKLHYCYFTIASLKISFCLMDLSTVRWA